MTARRPFIIPLLACSLALAVPAQARIPVTVAATDSAQAPFTFADGSGLGRDLVDALNGVQSRYAFNYVLMPTLRVTEMVASGVIDLASLHNIAWGWDARWVEGLPVGIMKSLSGSGARALMIDTLKTQGADSFVGRLVSIIQGSSETTFYVLAVYFGAVNIKNTRYAAGCGLFADAVGFAAAAGVAYVFFG